MDSVTKFPYDRLRDESWFDEAEEERAFEAIRKARKWARIRRFSLRKRPKIRIPGLRRFRRKRSRLLSRVKLSWGRALKRLKTGQAHMNDLFGRNFLVMQVSHSPFRCGERLNQMGLPPSRYSVGRTA